MKPTHTPMIKQYFFQTKYFYIKKELFRALIMYNQYLCKTEDLLYAYINILLLYFYNKSFHVYIILILSLLTHINYFYFYIQITIYSFDYSYNCLILIQLLIYAGSIIKIRLPKRGKI